MSQHDNRMKGVLFRNEDKREGKRDPDYRGNGEVNGVAIWIDAWINSSKDGKTKYMSLSFKPKQAKGQHGASQAPRAAPAVESEFDTEIPF